MTFRMIEQLWNTNTSACVSCDADLTENYMYISMKFGTGVHVFCWEVGVFNRSSFQSVSYNVKYFYIKGREGVYQNFYIKSRSRFLLKYVVYLLFFMQGDSYIIK